MAEVANLELQITGKDSASAALQSVAQSLSVVSAQISQLAVSGAGGDQALQGISSSAQSANSGLSSVAQGASSASSGLDDVSGSADDAGTGMGAAGQSASTASSGIVALGTATDVASQGLASASVAARSFGADISPITSIGGEVVGVLGTLGSGLGAVAAAAGVAAIAIVGVGAALIGSVLSSTAAWGDQLNDLADISGIDENSLAGLQIRLEEVGGSINDAASASQFLSRQLESLATGAINDAASAAQQSTQDIQQVADLNESAARRISDANEATADSVSQSQERLAQAYQDTQDKIQTATEREVQNLDDLATAHEANVQKIKDDIQSLSDDYATSEQERSANLKQSLTDRAQSEADSLNNMGFNHTETLNRLNRQLSQAKTAAARADVQFSIQQENDKYTRSVAMEKTRNDQQDARDQKRYKDAETKAKAQYDKQLAALQKRLDDEDVKYQAQVTKEQARYDAQLASLNKAYADQEKATAEHIARTEAANAKSVARIAADNAASISKATTTKAGGGSTTKSDFEVELEKVLTAAGLTAEQVKAKMASITSGEATVGDILPDIADGFKAEADAAEKAGTKVNLAGQMFKLFGRGASADWLAVLEQGGDGFRNDAALAEEFGVSLDKTQKKELADYIKAMADLKAAFHGLEVTIGVELMPTITEWAKQLTAWVKEHKPEIIAFFDDLGKKAQAVTAWFKQHWPEIQLVLDTAWKLMKPQLDALKQTFDVIVLALDILSGDWDKVIPDLKTVWDDFWNPTKQAFEDMIAVPQRISDAFTNIDFSGVLSGLGNGLTAGWNDLVGEDGSLTRLTGIPSDIVDAFTSFDWGDIAGAIESPFSDAWDWVQKVDWVGLGKEIIGDIVKGIGSAPISIGKAITDKIPKGNPLNLIPGRAGGGPVNAGDPYWVGEKGVPELFVPNSSGTIIPSSSIRSGTAAAAGGNIIINMPNARLSERDKQRARTVAFSLAHALKSQQGMAVL